MMTLGDPAVEITRGPFVEAVHSVHAAIFDTTGQMVAGWGDVGLLYLPRSSCKMIQALPWVESGAADGLSDAQLALSCASHTASALHRDAVARWLGEMGLDDDALRCGPAEPDDIEERNRLIRAGEPPMQVHNVCSGKHCGYLAHAQHLKAGPEYIDVDHPVQRAVQATLEELTGVVSPGHAPDGCSAPNFATTISGLAMALGQYAGAAGKGDARSRAMTRLAGAMMAHPELVHGTGDFDTDMMRALPGQVVLKRGAEGCQSAILPQRGLGIALKCADGAKRGAEAAMTAILVALGVIEADHPVARAWSHKPIVNCRGAVVGHGRPVAGWPGPIS